MRTKVLITQVASASQVVSTAGHTAAGGWGGVSAQAVATINQAGGGNISVDYCLTLPTTGSATGTFRKGAIMLLPPGVI